MAVSERLYHRLSNLCNRDWNLVVLRTEQCCDYARLVYKFFRDITSGVTMYVTISKGRRMMSSKILSAPSNKTSFIQILHIAHPNTEENNTTQCTHSPKASCACISHLTNRPFKEGFCILGNQVAQLSCVAARQTQSYWNQHHLLRVLVQVAHSKIPTVSQDRLISPQNSAIFSPLTVHKLAQSSIVR